MFKKSISDRSGARVELKSIRKTYRGSTSETIRGVDLDIRAGEFMTFLGSSGTGKTTTLNMIAGFETVSSGSISVAGDDISSKAPHERGLGMVFQNYALFPHMTVEENVSFPLKQRRVSRDQIRSSVARALELVDLSAFGERIPSQLSGGQQQRVALARAIVYSPRVLLLDEPLGALDRRLRENLQIEISRIHKELGLTFVYVTHDQEEALGMSDRIALFRDGRIEQVGTPDEVYRRPANSYVATFLGDSNVFPGTWDDGVFTSQVGKFDAPVTNLSDGNPSNAELVIRPEHMRLTEIFESGSNAVRGRVVNVMFLGPYRRVSVVLPNGQVCLVREPVGSAKGVCAGDEVDMSWLPNEGIAVPVG